VKVPLPVPVVAIWFWKNQNPCCASPLLSRRSDPKYSTWHVDAVPLGQVPVFEPVDGNVYLAAKLCSRLSFAGRPPAPSFHAHWLTSFGSFDPPPVKMVVFTFGSDTQSTAVAPVVLFVVEQSLPVTW
jgi:hypothetical protein